MGMILKCVCVSGISFTWGFVLFFVLFHNSLIPALLYLFVCFCLSIKHYFGPASMA